jgi:hypothetical protein
MSDQTQAVQEAVAAERAIWESRIAKAIKDAVSSERKRAASDVANSAKLSDEERTAKLKADSLEADLEHLRKNVHPSLHEAMGLSPTAKDESEEHTETLSEAD